MTVLIGYMGFSQQDYSANWNRHVTTFSNGEESITITESRHMNVLTLSSSDSAEKYEILELSNHEAAHRQALPEKIEIREKTSLESGNYTFGGHNRDSVSAPVLRGSRGRRDS